MIQKSKALQIRIVYKNTDTRIGNKVQTGYFYNNKGHTVNDHCFIWNSKWFFFSKDEN